jgi:hypothetical protein
MPGVPAVAAPPVVPPVLGLLPPVPLAPAGPPVDPPLPPVDPPLPAPPPFPPVVSIFEPLEQATTPNAHNHPTSTNRGFMTTTAMMTQTRVRDRRIVVLANQCRFRELIFDLRFRRTTTATDDFVSRF